MRKKKTWRQTLPETHARGDKRKYGMNETRIGSSKKKRSVQRTEKRTLGCKKHNGGNKKFSWWMNCKVEPLRKMNGKAKRWKMREKWERSRSGGPRLNAKSFSEKENGKRPSAEWYRVTS